MLAGSNHIYQERPSIMGRTANLPVISALEGIDGTDTYFAKLKLTKRQSQTIRRICERIIGLENDVPKLHSQAQVDEVVSLIRDFQEACQTIGVQVQSLTDHHEDCSGPGGCPALGCEPLPEGEIRTWVYPSKPLQRRIKPPVVRQRMPFTNAMGIAWAPSPHIYRMFGVTDQWHKDVITALAKPLAAIQSNEELHPGSTTLFIQSIAKDLVVVSEYLGLQLTIPQVPLSFYKQKRDSQWQS